MTTLIVHTFTGNLGPRFPTICMPTIACLRAKLAQMDRSANPSSVPTRARIATSAKKNFSFNWGAGTTSTRPLSRASAAGYGTDGRLLYRPRW